MTTARHYAEALQQFRLEYFLPLVLAFGGNASEAARQCGVHRNTVWRCLNRAGFNQRQLHALAKAARAHRGSANG